MVGGRNMIIRLTQIALGYPLLLDQLPPPLPHDGAAGLHHLHCHLHHCYCGEWIDDHTLVQVGNVGVFLLQVHQIDYIQVLLPENLDQPASPEPEHVRCPDECQGYYFYGQPLPQWSLLGCGRG